MTGIGVLADMVCGLVALNPCRTLLCRLIDCLYGKSKSQRHSGVAAREFIGGAGYRLRVAFWRVQLPNRSPRQGGPVEGEPRGCCNATLLITDLKHGGFPGQQGLDSIDHVA
ncbi:hypothetical protein F4820DRAFT_73505 [Hypoxylon rubiginosum]|uniref:Uncharacterized protein n=1 Tax=Hypoxylon rubiginosum TaxID=110542 RepID=A0ACB9YPW2_9PEZI|nr:hypothetical protein F4820DRAFT_73505 [Hypoxylon rubiginosum]